MKNTLPILFLLSTLFSVAQIENGKYKSEEEYIHFLNDSLVEFQLINIAFVDPNFEFWSKDVFKGLGKFDRLNNYLIISPLPDSNVIKDINQNKDTLIISILNANGKPASISILNFYKNDSLLFSTNTDIEGHYYSSPINADSIYIQADPLVNGKNFSTKFEGFNEINITVPSYLFDNRNQWIFIIVKESSKSLELKLINHSLSEHELYTDSESIKSAKSYYRKNKSYYARKKLNKTAANIK